MEQTKTNIQEHKADKDSLIRYGILSGVFLITAVSSVLITAIRIGEHPFNRVHFWTTVFMGILFGLYAFGTVRKRGFSKEDLIVALVSVTASAVLYLIFGSFTFVPLWIAGALAFSFFIDLPAGLFLGYFYLLQEHHYYADGFNSLVIVFSILTVLCIAAYLVGKRLTPEEEENMGVDILKNLNKQKNNESAEKGLAYLETFAMELDNKASVEYSVENAPVYPKDTVASEPKTDLAEKSEEKENIVVSDMAEPVPDVDYSAYAREISELLEKLKAFKRSAYIHSLRVAVIAEGCARDLGFDPVFAKAVGLYHEIGKSAEGDAYTNTISILKENNFPEKLIDAIDETTSKKNPFFTTKEAGVVAITDTIITTYLYLKKSSQAAIAPLKIIDSAMTKYMLNGRLDNAGISLKDCGDIKNYFLGVLEELEKNNQ